MVGREMSGFPCSMTVDKQKIMDVSEQIGIGLSFTHISVVVLSLV